MKLTELRTDGIFYLCQNQTDKVDTSSISHTTNCFPFNKSGLFDVRC